jgi:heme/copper-type cytochrome/quinol oxidase subunit 4
LDRDDLAFRLWKAALIALLWIGLWIVIPGVPSTLIAILVAIPLLFVAIAVPLIMFLRVKSTLKWAVERARSGRGD